MQSGATLTSQIHGTAGALVARLSRAHLAVIAQRQIIAAHLLQQSLAIGVDDALVLAMYSNNRAKLAKHPAFSVGIAQKHSAGGSAEKCLDAAHLREVHFFKFIEIGIGGTNVSAIVHHAVFSRLRIFRLKVGDGDGGRLAVGHIHHGSNAPCGCSTALACDVGLVCHAGVTEMHMRVDGTRQNQCLLHIKFLVTFV